MSSVTPNVDFYRGKRKSDGRFGESAYLQDILAWDDLQLERERFFIQWLFPVYSGDYSLIDWSWVDKMANNCLAEEDMKRIHAIGDSKTAGGNGKAYNLSMEEVLLFRGDKQLQESVLLSYERMLEFLGLKSVLEYEYEENINQEIVEYIGNEEGEKEGYDLLEYGSLSFLIHQKIQLTVVPRDDFEHRLYHILCHPHNLRRISRMMTSLCDMGLYEPSLALYRFYSVLASYTTMPFSSSSAASSLFSSTTLRLWRAIFEKDRKDGVVFKDL